MGNDIRMESHDSDASDGAFAYRIRKESVGLDILKYDSTCLGAGATLGSAAYTASSSHVGRRVTGIDDRVFA